MNGVRKPRSVLLAAVAVGASIGSSRLCGAPVPSLSAFARIPLCGPVIVHADFRAQQRRGICVGPRSPGSDPFTMAAAKRKTAESALSPARNVKRGKHRSAKDDADDVDDADLIIIGEDEGTGAFPVTKSSGYSAATDPETARQQAAALGIPERHVKGALALLDEGSTVPFIARYRKEATGGMDETQLRSLVRALERRQKVGDRRAAIIESLSKAKQLTEAIQKALNAATSLSELEDIYLPLRPKRKTRASDARAKGLDDLALVLMGQLPEGFVAPPVGANPYQNGPSWLTADPLVTARRFIKSAANSGDGSHSERLAGLTPEDALAGARDIAAQIWAEEPEIRKRAREPGFLQRALHVKSKERKKGADLHGNYLTYHDYSRPLNIAPPHAILALARGDREKILSIKLLHGEHEKGVLLGIMRKKLHERTRFSLSAAWKEQVETALTDSINRLLLPSLEREWWKEALEAAEEASFKTFAVNLRARLLQPPVKNYAVLGIDPGIRTGCKAALISPTGAVEDTLTFFPKGGGMAKDAMHLSALLERKSGGTEILVALGNGKGSRDAEAFLRNDVAPLLPANLSLRMTIIDEGGASVYSASELAGKELPAMDVTLRGAVSIARRLQDPLGELVKIEPKALGVGLYQHDVNQKRLSAELANVVESAVNAVGVDVNTASPSLLQYVAGKASEVDARLVVGTGVCCVCPAHLEVAARHPTTTNRIAGQNCTSSLEASTGCLSKHAASVATHISRQQA